LNAWTLSSLTSLQGGSILILGLIQGAMLGFDLGGPVNKAAYAFALAAFAAGNYAPMAANFIASMTPPLAIGAAMLIAKNKYTKTEKAATAGCVVGGLAMISEFAIPFAAADPIKVVPALMAGSAVGAATSYLLGLTMAAPHGGYFVSFLSNNIVLFTVALIVGTAVSTVLLVWGRRNVKLEDLAVEGE
jgi:PTS system fructose-specific IIC component